jgi:hypothetical protein
MAMPADRFRPRPIDELGLWVPRALVASGMAPERPVAIPEQRRAPEQASLATAGLGVDPVDLAVQIDRVVPASGNVGVCGHQFWLGPGMGGLAVALWISTSVVHVLREGVRLKTVPSRFSADQLHQLLQDGGVLAGPAPLSSGPIGPFEVDRLVNACGLVGLAGRQHPIGLPLAGRRVIVRIDGAVMQILDHSRILLRTLPNPLREGERRRVRDARPAGPQPVVPDMPPSVDRRVSCRGAIMVAGQRITVGICHAGLTVSVTTVGDSFRVHHGDRLLTEVARTTSKPIARFKARKPERCRNNIGGTGRAVGLQAEETM